MRLLLVQTQSESPEGPIFPLGLAYLASTISKDFSVQAVDMNVVSEPFQTIREVGKTFRPDIIGLSIRNIKVAKPGEHVSSEVGIKEVVRRIRRLLPEIPIITGGSGFSLYAQPLMQSIKGISYGLVGEGEHALPMFLDRFPKPEEIKGIMYRQDDRVVTQGLAVQPEFGKLPWPRRDIFPIEAYKKYPTSIGVMTKRGCPYGCIHCSDTYLLGKHLRLRDPRDVVEELNYLRNDFDVYQFMFADQTFNTPVDHTKELLSQMIKADLGMQWTAYFTPAGLDEEMVDLFKRAGCSMLSFSPDCCGNGMLKSLRKGFLMEDLYRANSLIKKAEIPVTYNFMLGLPGESLLSLFRTLLFILQTKAQLRGLLQLHGLFIVPVRIYPHTVLRDIGVQQQLIEASDDLLQPRFSRPEDNLVHLADKAVIKAVTLLWKMKHRMFQ